MIFFFEIFQNFQNFQKFQVREKSLVVLNGIYFNSTLPAAPPVPCGPGSSTLYLSSQIFIAQLILVTEYELRGTSFGLPGLKNVFSVMILVEFEPNLEQKYSDL